MGFFDKLKKITTNLFSGFSEADEAFFEELEETLILADLGMDTALDAVEKLRTRVRKEKLQDQEAVKAALRDILAEEMDVGGTELDLSTRPAVVLFIGVNGVGKTTTIGKLAGKLRAQNKKVVLAAASGSSSARRTPSGPQRRTNCRSGRSGPAANLCASTRGLTPARCCSTPCRLPRQEGWMWCCATLPAASTTRLT